MKVSIRARTYETGTSVTSPIWYTYGIVEFLGRGGSYIDSLFGLYKNAVIHAATITVKAVNMSSEPLIVAVAPLPHNWSTLSPTIAEICDAPRCVRRNTGGNSGQDRAILSTSISTAKALGHDYQIARYSMDSTQAASTTPLIATEPAWTLALSSFNSLTSASYRAEIEMEWHVEFYNLDSS